MIKHYNSAYWHINNNTKFKQAIGYLQQDKNQQAINCLKQYLLSEPYHAESYFLIGQACLNLKQYEQGQVAVDACLKINPRHLAAICLLAELSYCLGKYQTSILLLEKALEINPRHAEAYFWLGMSALKLAEVELARKSLLSAIALEPQHSSAHVQLSHLYIQQGRYAKALLHNKAYYHLCRQSPVMLYQMGICYIVLGRSKEAVWVLTKYRQIHGHTLGSKELLSQAYYQLKYYDLALNLGLDAVKSGSQSVEVNYLLAQCFNLLGKEKLSKHHLNLGYQLNQTSVHKVSMHAEQLLELGLFEMAFKDFKADLITNPKSFVSQFGMGKALLKLQKYHGAATCFHQILFNYPKQAEISYYLAQVYFKLARFDLCNYVIERVLADVNEQLPSTINSLKFLHACATNRLGKQNAAVIEFQKIETNACFNFKSKQYEATKLFYTGEYANAWQIIQNQLKCLSIDNYLLYMAAECLFYLNKLNLGIKILHTFIQACPTDINGLKLRDKYLRQMSSLNYPNLTFDYLPIINENPQIETSLDGLKVNRKM